MSKRWQNIWTVGLLAVWIITVMSGCALQADELVSGEEEPDPVAVVVHEAGVSDLTDYLRFSGRVMGAGEIPIIPMTTGLIKEVRVQIGDMVRKDDVIVILDDAQINKQIDQLESASAEMKDRISEIEQEVEDLLDMPAEDILPDNSFDRLTEVTQLMSEMQMIAGQLGQVESAIAQAKGQKEQMTVKAQAAGKVAILSAHPGGVAVSGNPVAVLMDTSKMYVDIQVFENQISLIRKNQEAVVQVPAYSEYPLKGKVNTISAVLNAQSRAYNVRILLDEMGKGSLENQGLYIGMFARVEIPAHIYEQVLTLPREAVLEMYEGQFVFIVEENRAVKRQVETGFNTNEEVEILSGVEQGDMVVTTGQHFLEDGDRVMIDGWGEEN